MKETTKYVGLDVSKKKLLLRLQTLEREQQRFLGMIENKPEAIRTLVKKLRRSEQLKICYETWLTTMNLPIIHQSRNNV
jgi:transposase